MQERPYKVSIGDLEQEQEFHRGHTGVGTPTPQMITQYTYVMALTERLERIEEALRGICDAMKAPR